MYIDEHEHPIKEVKAVLFKKPGWSNVDQDSCSSDAVDK